MGSKLVNCPVFCNPINAVKALDVDNVMDLMTCLADLNDPFDDNKDYSFQIISIVTSFDWHHRVCTGLVYSGVCTL